MVQEDLLDAFSNKLKDKNINVALIGPTASGKSSLVNSYSSIVSNQISCRSHTSYESPTLRFLQIKLERQLENITLYDTMGIEEGHCGAFQMKHAKATATGEIKPGRRNEVISILNFLDPSYIGEDIDDKFEHKKPFQHCVVFVLDGEKVLHGLKDELISTIGEIMHKLKSIEKGQLKASKGNIKSKHLT
ncbi:uncharacterized protein LOC132717975 [Ruditapes philippinarum]|uniref:uncharacterized protein LOC132717975 n=1 Tax=Ruditapes philippinarum TaxID=129788 RepID=UPI00295B4C06|nr:uncharacterized protein LOC132717975 [Ruditapes philippinarum]